MSPLPGPRSLHLPNDPGGGLCSPFGIQFCEAGVQLCHAHFCKDLLDHSRLSANICGKKNLGMLSF